LKLLVCVDGSPQSMKAVVKAVEIASGCQINEVTLISVYDKYPFPLIEDGSKYRVEEEMKKYNLLNEQMINHHKKYLEHAAMRFREKGIEPDLILKEGHPAHSIAEAAKEGGFDMIIMGSRGRGNLKSLLLGSVSNAVIQQTHASVLVVK
jgi:nucleotide-binding universal stress UspA family protein